MGTSPGSYSGGAPPLPTGLPAVGRQAGLPIPNREVKPAVCEKAVIEDKITK
jgi:hypothetical protein